MRSDPDAFACIAGHGAQRTRLLLRHRHCHEPRAPTRVRAPPRHRGGPHGAVGKHDLRAQYPTAGRATVGATRRQNSTPHRFHNGVSRCGASGQCQVVPVRGGGEQTGAVWVF